MGRSASSGSVERSPSPDQHRPDQQRWWLWAGSRISDCGSKTAMSLADLTRDLIAEQDDLDRIVSALDTADLALPTPSPRWSIADQLGHLAYFDKTAALAINEPEAFDAHRKELFAAPSGADADLDAATLGTYRAMSADELLADWRGARAALAAAAGTLGEKDRVEWYGPSMGAKSFLTARLMEAWAHGQDIADTAGVERSPSNRLIHIAAARNRDYEIISTDILCNLSQPICLFR